MFSSLKRLSSKVALGGAEDAIDDVKDYIDKNPQEKFVINKRSKALFEIAVASLGLSLDNNLLSEEFYTPDFHRVAHDFKQKCNRNFQKNTSDWAAANLAMAGCSILGASPDLPKRERVWLQLMEVWDE